MKWVALLPVRDEADIIAQCLDSLLAWCDRIYVFDTGSIDNTWDIVNDYAGREKQVVPIEKRAVYFTEFLRGYIFDRIRGELQDGDWFIRADADEFYHVAPPQFVETAVQGIESVVYHQHYNFCLMDFEVDAWFNGQEARSDRKRPISDRRRHYRVSVYSEPRLCRYRRSMQWPSNCSFPVNAGFIARERIAIRHYPHRDPEQLVRRCRLRAMMSRSSWRAAVKSHPWNENDWRAFVVSCDTPDVSLWVPGSDLPEPHFANHLRPWPIRCLQWLFHSTIVRQADRFRPRFPHDIALPLVDTAQQESLEEELRQYST